MALLLLFLLLAARLPALSAEEWQTAFRQSFPGDRAPNGWQLQGTSWRVADSMLTLATREYDQIAAAPFWQHAEPPYAVSATLRGTRSGLFFGLEERSSKALSHMVRFEGKRPSSPATSLPPPSSSPPARSRRHRRLSRGPPSA